jgi:hypothetical protein
MEFEDWELLNYPKVSNLLECDGRLDKKKEGFTPSFFLLLFFFIVIKVIRL